MLSPEILSERLSLRAIQVEDVEALHSLWTDVQVRRFLWDGEVIPLERTRKIVENSYNLFDEYSYGIWGIRECGFNELLGFAGIGPSVLHPPSSSSLAWRRVTGIVESLRSPAGV